jgi:BolA-like protein 3
MQRFLRVGLFSTKTAGESLIENKLSVELKPTTLSVKDISGGCGSMYQIDIRSDYFKGLSTLKQHRKIQEILKEDIKQMHGITINSRE